MDIATRAAAPIGAQQLVDWLEEIIREHGDLPVLIGNDDSKVYRVDAYDADGDMRGKRTEIMIYGC